MPVHSCLRAQLFVILKLQVFVVVFIFSSGLQGFENSSYIPDRRSAFNLFVFAADSYSLFAQKLKAPTAWGSPGNAENVI